MNSVVVMKFYPAKFRSNLNFIFYYILYIIIIYNNDSRQLLFIKKKRRRKEIASNIILFLFNLATSISCVRLVRGCHFGLRFPKFTYTFLLALALYTLLLCVVTLCFMVFACGLYYYVIIFDHFIVCGLYYYVNIFSSFHCRSIVSCIIIVIPILG